MTLPAEHMTDEQLSAHIDDQLTLAEASVVRAHLDTCADCQLRLVELRALVHLVQALPSIDPPRDFVLERPARLEVVSDPPNVIRLRRWYTAARASAATLAAAFVLLSAGTLYVDTHPSVPESTVIVQPRVVSAPAAAARDSTAALPTVGQKAAAPAPAAVARSQAAPSQEPAAAGDASDQFAAATSVRPLPPTQVPTLQPTPTLVPVLARVRNAEIERADPTAPLRVAATVAGILALLGVLTALIVRNRLMTAVTHLRTE